MTPDTTGMTLLVSPARREILETLANLPVVATVHEPHTRGQGLTASELGRRVGLHSTTVRFHVDQLVAAGLLTGHDVRVGVGRPRRHYAVNPGRLAELDRPDTYRVIAELLAQSMADGQASGTPQSVEDAAAQWVEQHASRVVPDGLGLDAARTPGHFLAKIGALVDVLRSWGYATSIETKDAGQTAEVRLTDCPIWELAKTNPAIGCGIHRGLVRATMTKLGEPEAVIGLTPFVEPGLCIARITTTHPLRTQEDRP